MSQKYEIRYLPAAEKDLTNILEYIKKDNSSAALKLINEIDETISRLEEFPNMGVIPKDLRLKSLNYRMLIVGNYLVFYTATNNVVEIRRVLHGKRKYSFLL
jgi:addiction module RelE/StbE family toxin